MRVALAFVISTAAITDVEACPRESEDDLPCDEPWARWSWQPRVAALVGYGSDGVPREVLGAELRLRRNPPKLEREPRAYTLGLGAETFRRSTLEPYVVLGIDELSEPWCRLCRNDVRMFGIAHIAAGGGVRSSTASRSRPFGLVRVALGLVFARPAGGYIALDGERGDVHATRFRLRSQLDLVLETVIAADGEWRFAVGFAIDPVRILSDLAAFGGD
jgi:hypothetical protein